VARLVTYRETIGAQRRSVVATVRCAARFFLNLESRDRSSLVVQLVDRVVDAFAHVVDLVADGLAAVLGVFERLVDLFCGPLERPLLFTCDVQGQRHQQYGQSIHTNFTLS
jgi:hypothetical protein